ncbi:MAG: type IV pilus modification protein PilV [Zoogloeaceae bacterium]|nr:type IV pilus modification protein PilV [Zoogloeaceae bacterium]
MKPNLAFSDCTALQAGDALDSRRERGFTLIEVLVTVFILCLGLLGVGSLQYLSMKSNQSALARAVATEYAYQVLDYIRSKPGMTMWPGNNLNPTAKCNESDFCKPRTFKFISGTLASEDGGIDDLFEQLKEDLGEETKMSVCLSNSANLGNTQIQGLVSNCYLDEFTATSPHKYYVVTIQAPNRASANSTPEPIQIVVVGEVL